MTYICYRVDTDQNGYIRQEELETWIVAKIQEHFKEAAEENEAIFKQLDVDKDGISAAFRFFLLFLWLMTTGGCLFFRLDNLEGVPH